VSLGVVIFSAIVIIVFDGWFFGDILVAQRNASPAMALMRRL
jgi:hypothetical protein